MKNAEKRSQKPIAARVFYMLGGVLMVLGLLYIAKPVLVPIALSVLLAFILSPLVHTLEGWRMGRIPAVLLASFMAFALLALSGWALVNQIHSLAEELPRHRQEIKAKIDSLSGSENSTFGRLSAMFNDVTKDIGKESTDEPRESAALGGLISGPIPVVVKDDDGSQWASLANILLPIIQPLAESALVIVLVIFLLIQREDMRYRVIALLGESALTGTTRLMRDTAQRVNSYLLNLLLVNAGFGIWFGAGLYFLGVPYAPLWGFLTLVLRFIPFLGSPASVLFPLLISIATSSGWSQPIYVAVFFAVSELFTANVLEPIVFGKTTGLTPIALLIAALFWAWIWGPIGLLLSTPLTVCLVVLGQHLPPLRSLKVLLAEQPTLDARLQFFQRLLSGDSAEGKRVFEDYSTEFGREKAFDDVIIPALRWTRRERNKESITVAEEKFIYSVSSAAIQKENNSTDSDSDPSEESSSSVCRGCGEQPLRVFGYPVHHESEEVALLILQEMLGEGCRMELATTKNLPSTVVDKIVDERPDVVILAAMPPRRNAPSPIHVY